MNRTILMRYAAILISCWFAMPAFADSEWQRVNVDPAFVDADGVLRFPSCAVAPVLVQTEAGPQLQATDSSYAFFVKPGNPQKLAIFFDGGGSCWDGSTCVATPLAGSSIYSLTVDETVASLSEIDGIGDDSEPGSPIDNYTQVFIPYCTGDLHTGAADTDYLAQTPIGPLPWTIRHRGADNVAAVMAWLDDYYGQQGQSEPKRLFVFGASAGGYGAIYHYPALAERFAGATRNRLFIDAANGVINQDFYDRALAAGGGWNVQANLHPVLAAAFAGDPVELTLNSILSIGAAWPETRIGQYTNAFDLTQIFFFNVAENLANPALWTDPAALGAALAVWAPRAAEDMVIAASLLPNYRHYLASGSAHTIVGSDRYYLEDSGDGIVFADWMKDMLSRESTIGSDWQNVSCLPSCIP